VGGKIQRYRAGVAETIGASSPETSPSETARKPRSDIWAYMLAPGLEFADTIRFDPLSDQG